MARIVLLGTHNDPAKDMVYNAINPLFEISTVIAEKPVSRMTLVKRRIRKLGWFRVVGQLCFQLVVVKILNIVSRKRVSDLKAGLPLDTTAIPQSKLQVVDSVNDEACIRLLKELQPDLILVKGTRILSKAVLESTSAPFINTHVGITPLYRGVHGAYWALINNDRKNAGTTIHYVDAGIDTGSIIAQQRIEISEKDNFVTYPLLQIAAGISLLKENLPAILEGKKVLLTPLPQGRSHLWSHPTMWFYLRKRLINGIK